MNAELELEDVRWLVGPEAACWLERAAADAAALPTQVQRLRKELSPRRAHLVLQQVELRRRAVEKFSQARRMFFTRVGLEQATDEVVARYKARRYPDAAPVADLCCGIGGDLLALAVRGSATGVDRDAATTVLADANLAALAAESLQAVVCVADVETVALDEFAAWHIDPDRRDAGRRTSQIAFSSPPAEVLDRLRARCPHAGIKLAPAAETPDSWKVEAELEWISRDGQCRQQVAWFGRLAVHPGDVQATILNRLGQPRTVRGKQHTEVPAADRIGRYIFEPDAAVLAAELTGSLAHELSLTPLAAGHVYLTGDAPLNDAAVAGFEVDNVLPFDLRKLRDLLRRQGIGRLEIMVRGVKHDPAQVRRQLGLRGEGSATLLVTRLGERVVAIVSRRMPGVT